MKCMIKEGLGVQTRGEMQDLGRNASGYGVWSEGKVFGGRKKTFLSREREREKWKWNLISRWAVYRKTKINRSRSYWDLSSTKSRQMWICRGAVEDFSTTKIPRWIKKLSRIYRPNRKLLDGSKNLSSIYLDKVQKSRWIRITLIAVETRWRRAR